MKRGKDYKHPSGSQKRQNASKRKLEKAGGDASQSKLQFGGGSRPVVVPSVSPGPSESDHLAQGDGDNSSIAILDDVTEEDAALHSPLLNTDVVDLSSDIAMNEESDHAPETDKTTVNNSTARDDSSVEDDVPVPGSHGETAFFVPPAQDATLAEKKAFLAHHPIQPQPTATKLPFDHLKVFFTTSGTEYVQRMWLSYCTFTDSLICTSCMCFDSRSVSPFVSGLRVIDRKGKDLHKAIGKHEISSSHRNAVSAQVAAFADKDIASLLSHNLASLNAQEKEKRRAIVGRIIDLCIFIGTQGIAFRGKRGEGIESLQDRSVNHGNFLELALLLAKYDPILKAHIDQCTEIARKQNSAGKASGRGSLVTFLSKDSINKLIRIIGTQIQTVTTTEIRKAGIFAVEVDSTQDVSVLDQLAIVLRFVSPAGAQEKMLTLAVSHDGTGLGLYTKLKQELDRFSLDTSNNTACSFDGASNMSGCFKGLQARLKEDNPDLIFTHCAGHCLNLVLTSCSESCNAAKSLFGLVESGAVFISDSYKRMDVWSQIIGERNEGRQKLRRLGKIGKTRWWSKPNALKSVIDADGDKTTKLADFLLCMEEIGTCGSFDAKACFMAESLRNSWCKFETILLSKIMLSIYDLSTPVSNALQSPSIDYLVTFSLVQSLQKKLQSMRDKFDHFVEKTVEYVNQVNEQLQEAGCESITLKSNFSPSRTATAPGSSASSRRTRGTAENGPDQEQIWIDNAKESFRIKTFLVVVDHVTAGLSDRFNPNEDLLRDLSVLDPKGFLTGLLEKDSSSSLDTVSSLAKVDARMARIELQGFSDVFESLAPAPSSSGAGAVNGGSDTHDAFGLHFQDEDDEVEPKAKCEECNRCIGCAFKLFIKVPMLQCTYPTLFALYKYALTLPLTQVSCERIFSKLKIIKTRLRASLSQCLLELLLLMSVERECAVNIDRNVIIEQFASSSLLLSRLLL